MNLHLSEILSDILEPLVETLEYGDEVISTEDLLAQVKALNTKFRGWDKNSWWEGVTEDNFICCGKCEGDEEYVWDRNSPELCRCKDVDGMNDLGMDNMGYEDTTTGRSVGTDKTMVLSHGLESNNKLKKVSFGSLDMYILISKSS